MSVKKKLRTGFTTGTAAAAATKGALFLILTGEKPSSVQIELLNREKIKIPIYTCKSLGQNKAECMVIKDAGDDPDITHKAKIGVIVTLLNNKNQKKISITGGKGVGIVTKPGLEVKPGKPAINSGPEKMITQAVMESIPDDSNQSVHIKVFVPEGEKLAKKTLNARLGIIDGISILGTTGLERPMSHEAYIATIKSALSVAKASNVKRVVLTTGRRSERFSQALFKNLSEEAFIQIGDFFKMSLDLAVEKDFDKITIAVFFGKAIKMAQGIPHTHAAKSVLSLQKLSAWAFEVTNNQELAKKILSANTARHTFDFINNDYPQVISYVGKLIIKSARVFTGKDIQIQSIIFDYNGNVVFNSEK